MSDRPVWEEVWCLPGEMLDARLRVEIAFPAPDSEGRARLAACAPEAIRLLLEAEWPNWTCFWCGAQWKEDTREAHKPDCRWLALMRKAGVRE